MLTSQRRAEKMQANKEKSLLVEAQNRQKRLQHEQSLLARPSADLVPSEAVQAQQTGEDEARPEADEEELTSM